LEALEVKQVKDMRVQIWAVALKGEGKMWLREEAGDGLIEL
jgi:hypothetical protein